MDAGKESDFDTSSSSDTLLESQTPNEQQTRPYGFRVWLCVGTLALAIFALTSSLSAIIDSPLRHDLQNSKDGHYQWNATQRYAAPVVGKSCDFSTPAEAREADCVFDALTTSWVPHECADLDLTEQYLRTVSALPQWPFYYDEAGTQEWRDLDLLKSGEWNGHLWVTGRAHKLHCLFAWQRLHQVLLGGKHIDTVVLGPYHTEHCKKVLAGGHHAYADDKVAAYQSIQYRDC
ncbi:hypothetical protein AC578_9915 [Pseudocercospora eumusae]|uniref:Uncharacterized protein n=1 Tax=Pseudocercospora eumusae TaxID=321146 RepID=A0A139HB71_9PEZI|nr:hypothetical protein AC578_9915 [Pseudocercospora eumusae]